MVRESVRRMAAVYRGLVFANLLLNSGTGAPNNKIYEPSEPVRSDEKRADIREAFLSLGCALICWSLHRTWTRPLL